MIKLIKKIKKYGFKSPYAVIDYILHQGQYDFIAEQLEEFFRNEMESNIQ